MSGYADLVAEALEAVQITSRTRYKWFGDLSPRLSSKVSESLRPDVERRYLHSSLTQRLYHDFYCLGSIVREVAEHAPGPRGASSSFVSELSAANAGIGRLEPGWKVLRVDAEYRVVAHRGITVRVPANDPEGSDDRPVAPGGSISVRTQKEFFNLSPGFYTAISDFGDARRDVHRVRVYFNLTPAGAIRLMGAVTEGLNSDRLPFRLKVLNQPLWFRRSDAVVLYVRRTDFQNIRRLLESLYPQLTRHLRPATPVFTKMLAPGVGLAEDPDDGQSFGIHRCGLLADALIEAWERSLRSVEDRLAVVRERFAREGIALDAAYRGPHSNSSYEFSTRKIDVDETAPKPATVTEDGQDLALLEVATAIAERLASQALWHENRCNWIDTVPSANGDDFGVSQAALGPELYAGTSGIALFLAGLYSVGGGNCKLQHTALGAIRQALQSLRTRKTKIPSGLYTGRVGIVVAATHVARLLRSDECYGQVEAALEAVVSSEMFEEPFDLLSGRAGATVGLLALHSLLGDEVKLPLLDLAIRYGRDLVDRADDRFGGLAWRSRSAHSGRPLTGLSHGTAGVACALLELFRATQDAAFRRAAESALEYERQWFVTDQGNWRDLREGAANGEASRKPCALHWCHGAPGIALSRIRAFQVLRNDLYLAEARTAVATTERALEQALADGRGNYSLCHGLAGNAEVLVVAQKSLGELAGARSLLPAAIAQAGISRYGRTGDSWPCGGPATSLGLMLGLAGIGYFYARLFDHKIPSPIQLWGDVSLHRDYHRDF